MKNKLQYVYSITVFVGVLVTAYMMMNQTGSGRAPYRAMQAPALRNEANLDPAISQLLQMEDALSRPGEDLTRSPTELRPANSNF